jgi:hypothetical protein
MRRRKGSGVSEAIARLRKSKCYDWGRKLWMSLKNKGRKPDDIKSAYYDPKQFRRPR